jgi:hypothetical protein
VEIWFKHIPPWQVEWVPVRHNLDNLPTDADTVVTINLNVGIEGSEHGVILQQVRSLLHTSGVVDDNNLERRVFPPVPAPDEVASDTSESIDGNLDLGLSHGLLGARAGSLHRSTYKSASER